LTRFRCQVERKRGSNVRGKTPRKVRGETGTSALQKKFEKKSRDLTGVDSFSEKKDLVYRRRENCAQTPTPRGKKEKDER